MDQELSGDQLANLRLADSNLQNIRWDANRPELRMQFEACEGAPRIISLLFTWVSDLRLDLELGRSFKAMVWDYSFVRNDNGRWRVFLDFAGTPRSSIELECETIAAEQ